MLARPQPAPASLAAQERLASQPVAPQPVTDERPANLPEGIHRNFVDPDMDIEERLGRFEFESREVFAACEQVLEACEVRRGERIADVGGRDLKRQLAR